MVKATDLEFWPIDDASYMKGTVKPESIKTRGSAAGRFGKAEVEWSACKLLQFFQFKGRWTSFTITELTNFYKMKGWNPDEMFFGLSGYWYDDSGLMGDWVQSGPFLLLDPGGKYRVTNLFIQALLRD